MSYRFALAEETICIDILQEDTGAIRAVDAGPGEDVTAVMRLGTHQCSHCPLPDSADATCPLAALVCPVVARFADYPSFAPVSVSVQTPPREYRKDTTLQQGMRSLLGLLMGGSGCPYMTFFRPMARYHLPFSDEQETVYRAITNLALASYLLDRQGCGPLDMQRLEIIYADIHELNRGVSERLRMMTRSDATANAIVLLDMFAKSLGGYLEDGLEDVSRLYADFNETHAALLQGRKS